MIKATPAQLRTIKGILSRHLPEAEVRAFGSRVSGKPKDYSDLDLAVLSPQKIEAARLEETREAFAESDLPFRVDVLDWSAISEEFRKVIEAGYEILQKTGSRA
jgi:predicted nucleotidyltransferase